ncbi:MAG: DUF364 domain-containing protein [Oscillospiraceae bacterium]
MIIDELIEFTLPLAQSRKVSDVRAGLGYTCVMLDNAACGLAYTFRSELGHNCGVLGDAGSFIGKDAAEMIPWARDNNRLRAAIGLAAINAVLNDPKICWDTGNVMNAFTLSASDTFGMVGEFRPIVSKVKAMTDNIYVFELNPPEGSGLYPEDQIPVLLPRCDVVVITATSIINHTIDEVVSYCSAAREVFMVGPSTPLCPGVLRRHHITALAGSVVKDPARALQIVSQGGGTMNMKPAATQVLVRI